MSTTTFEGAPAAEVAEKVLTSAERGRQVIDAWKERRAANAKTRNERVMTGFRKTGEFIGRMMGKAEQARNSLVGKSTEALESGVGKAAETHERMVAGVEKAIDTGVAAKEAAKAKIDTARGEFRSFFADRGIQAEFNPKIAAVEATLNALLADAARDFKATKMEYLMRMNQALDAGDVGTYQNLANELGVLVAEHGESQTAQYQGILEARQQLSDLMERRRRAKELLGVAA